MKEITEDRFQQQALANTQQLHMVQNHEDNLAILKARTALAQAFIARHIGNELDFPADVVAEHINTLLGIEPDLRDSSVD